VLLEHSAQPLEGWLVEASEEGRFLQKFFEFSLHDSPSPGLEARHVSTCIDEKAARDSTFPGGRGKGGVAMVN
jgi:hypothetical protein